MPNSLSPEGFYPAFVTSSANDGPRIPISGERIVVVLGKDEETGLPLELSISLSRNAEQRLFVYAIREPSPELFPLMELTAEKGCENTKFLRVTVSKRMPPQCSLPCGHCDATLSDDEVPEGESRYPQEGWRQAFLELGRKKGWVVTGEWGELLVKCPKCAADHPA